MAKRLDRWQTISLHPITGPLDVRSRPADLPPGAFRWKLNLQTTTEGKLCRRAGFDRFLSDKLFDSVYHNHDHHSQGATRQPPTFLFESTDADGVRRLFDGTQSRVSLLDADTGYWTDIITGKGSNGSRWKAAELNGLVLFTNNVDNIQSYNIGTGITSEIPNLRDGRQVTAAYVIIEFNGFMFLMNMVQAGQRFSTRVRWSDLNDATVWDVVSPSLGGFQDLDYGDEILAAAPMLGGLYIYTRRSIWKCTTSSDPNTEFSFVKVYTEPKNQKGCLVYPNTLISTGSNHYYLSRETVYQYNPYIAEPERADQANTDWLHKAAGVIFRKADTALSGANCEAPIAAFTPVTNELWFSWPSASSPTNNWTLVGQIDQRTADVVDAGFMALTNFRRNPPPSAPCNEQQDFIGTSNIDWSIKSIGGVFFREYVIMPSADQTVDLDLNSPPATYERLGYNSELKGLLPLGLVDREKICRNVLIDHDTTEQDNPCRVHTRIGNSFNSVDPNDTDDTCAVLWHDIGTQPLTCPDGSKISAMLKNNLRPGLGMQFPCYEQGRFLFFWFTIEASDGSEAIGGDSCLQRIDFDSTSLAKA